MCKWKQFGEMEEEAGNFKTFLKKTSDLVNPKKLTETIHNRRENVANETKVDNETKSYASIISEIYKDKNKRSREMTVNGTKYALHPTYNSDEYGVYQSTDTNKPDNLFVYRGTKTLKDLYPDLKIGTGTTNFDGDRDNFNTIRQKLGNDNWKLLGHSLGATKAMWIGQREHIPTYAFNPGYSYLFEEKLNTTRPDLNLYFVDSDPISSGLVYEKLNKQTKIYKGHKTLPYSSHSINYFLN